MEGKRRLKGWGANLRLRRPPLSLPPGPAHTPFPPQTHVQVEEAGLVAVLGGHGDGGAVCERGERGERSERACGAARNERVRAVPDTFLSRPPRGGGGGRGRGRTRPGWRGQGLQQALVGSGEGGERLCGRRAARRGREGRGQVAPPAAEEKKMGAASMLSPVRAPWLRLPQTHRRAGRAARVRTGARRDLQERADCMACVCGECRARGEGEGKQSLRRESSESGRPRAAAPALASCVSLPLLAAATLAPSPPLYMRPPPAHPRGAGVACSVIAPTPALPARRAVAAAASAPGSTNTLAGGGPPRRAPPSPAAAAAPSPPAMAGREKHSTAIR